MKLQIIALDTTHSGRMHVLADEHGNVLPGQSRVIIDHRVRGPTQVTATFTIPRTGAPEAVRVAVADAIRDGVIGAHQDLADRLIRTALDIPTEPAGPEGV